MTAIEHPDETMTSTRAGDEVRVLVAYASKFGSTQGSPKGSRPGSGQAGITGVIDRHRWPFFSRLFYHALGGRLGDDRDWPTIEEWAEEIGRALRPEKRENRG